MPDPRVLTVQDISCVGQCSLTVALPILSACGLETAILPSAILSTHTAGFSGYTCRDLTEDIPAITDHWQREGLDFSAVYTGYLGSTRQVALVRDIFARLLRQGGRTYVDPAMADNGRLYPAFDADFVAAMKGLAFSADVILPNITEAALLTGLPYQERYDEAYIRRLLAALTAAGAKTVILTGVGYTPDTTGVAVWDGQTLQYYCHERISKGCHGTGDVFAAAFVGASLRGQSDYRAAVIAADYTVACIRGTQGDADHWYGVKFERQLPALMEQLG